MSNFNIRNIIFKIISTIISLFKADWNTGRSRIESDSIGFYEFPSCISVLLSSRAERGCKEDIHAKERIGFALIKMMYENIKRLQ